MSLRGAGAVAAIAAVTWALTLALARNAAAGGALASGLLPLVVTGIWAGARLMVRPPVMVSGAALLWSAAAVGAAPNGATVALGAYVLSGLLLGWALARGWRPDAALAAAVLPVAILLLAASREAPVERLLEETGRQVAQAMERAAPAGEAAAEQAKAGLAEALKLLRRLWPSLLVLGLLVNAAVVALAVRWGVARLGASPGPRAWPPFREWRLPFYLVWALAAGVALLITRAEPASRVGVNMILAALALCGVQGLAVMSGLLQRSLPAWGQALLGLLVVLAMAPVALPALALLGLLDQWVDFRRLAAAVGGGRQPGP